ncbi:MAG: hypothetical protein J0M12_17310 [Deltaproteobacteria bacterium]|nr:hypothetical protein [Deltaproteobacteria bacterium]
MMESPHITAQEKAAFFDQIADTVSAHRMSVPVIFLLEASKPLSTLLYTATLVSSPLLSALLGASVSRKLAALLESRADVEDLIRLLEARAEPQSRN